MCKLLQSAWRYCCNILVFKLASKLYYHLQEIIKESVSTIKTLPYKEISTEHGMFYLQLFNFFVFCSRLFSKLFFKLSYFSFIFWVSEIQNQIEPHLYHIILILILLYIRKCTMEIIQSPSTKPGDNKAFKIICRCMQLTVPYYGYYKGPFWPLKFSLFED